MTGLVALALVGAWVMWQPLRAAQEMTAAENAPGNAFAHARTAAGADPLSIEPHYMLAVLYQGIHDTAHARAEYVRATQIQPQNPVPWWWLANFNEQAGDAALARAAAERVLALDHTPDGYTTAAAATLAWAKGALRPGQKTR